MSFVRMRMLPNRVVLSCMTFTPVDVVVQQRWAISLHRSSHPVEARKTGTTGLCRASVLARPPGSVFHSNRDSTQRTQRRRGPQRTHDPKFQGLPAQKSMRARRAEPADEDPQLEEAQDSQLQRLANEITNKLMHKPTIEMRKALQNEDGERVQLLKSLLTPDPH